LDPRSLRVQIQLREVVQHINSDATDFHEFIFRKSTRPRSCIDIAANGGYGRNRCEALKNFRRADVAGMNNMFAALQRLKSFRSQWAVRVGDDAEEDRSSQFSVLSSQFSVLNFFQT
jgi:hypothetical protein